MAMFSFTFFWPIYSLSVLGRTLASRRASSSSVEPETIRLGLAGSSAARRANDFFCAKSAIIFQTVGKPKNFLLGLKPDRELRLTPGLKPRPPKELRCLIAFAPP